MSSPLASLEEHVGEAADWPVWMRELALKNKLGHQDQLNFLVTFLGNAAPPYVTIKHMLPKLENLEDVRSVKDVLTRLRAGTLPSHYRLEYWDLDLKESLPMAWAVHGPTFKDDISWKATFDLLTSHIPQMKGGSVISLPQRERAERNRRLAIARRKERAPARATECITLEQRSRAERSRKGAIARRHARSIAAQFADSDAEIVNVSFISISGFDYRRAFLEKLSQT